MTLDILRPKLEQWDMLRIITFTNGKVRDRENILGGELESRVDGLERGHLLLNFTNVTSIACAGLGSLIQLRKRLRGTGGQLTLFNLTDELYEVFTVTRLHTLLSICRPLQVQHTTRRENRTGRSGDGTGGDRADRLPPTARRNPGGVARTTQPG